VTRHDRGVSDLVGFVLTVGIILAGVGIVATVGVDQIEEIQGTQSVENAERAVTVLAGNLEALQESRATILSSELAVHNGRLSVGTESGPSSLTVDVATSGGADFTAVDNLEMRTIGYRTDDARILYEGGAVIFNGSSRGASVLLRDPAFVCSADRAVVSFVTVNEDGVGQGYGGATASVTTSVNESKSQVHYPANRSHDEPYTIDDATGVNVTVDSRRAAGWRTALSNQGWDEEVTTPSSVTYSCDVDQVIVRQTVVEIAIER